MIRFWFFTLLSAILVVGCQSKPSQSGAIDPNLKPKVVFTEKIYDFGNIKQGETVSHTFFFKNEGPGNLIIKDVIPSCGCTSSRYSKEPVAPGGEGQVEVLFDTEGWNGYQMKQLTLKLNTEEGYFTVTIEGNVKE